MQTTIVYGPAGCGKTYMSGAIAKSLGLSVIIDELSGSSCVIDGRYVRGKVILPANGAPAFTEKVTLPASGALALTESEEVARMFKNVRVMSFDEAVSQL